eukprot:4927929-Amphidinium_carterae.1
MDRTALLLTDLGMRVLAHSIRKKLKLEYRYTGGYWISSLPEQPFEQCIGILYDSADDHKRWNKSCISKAGTATLSCHSQLRQTTVAPEAVDVRPLEDCH